MGKSPGQCEDEQTVPITYRAVIYAQREGEEERRLDRSATGSSIGELAENVIAQTAELEAEAQGKLERAEAERGKEKQTASQKELSGRRRRSWE